MPAFEARDLVKDYGATRALAGIGFEVGDGELVGLLGPNGAGKSTLVKIACGLVRAGGGRVRVCGYPAGSAAARACLGYLAELFRFPPWLTGNEVLKLHQEVAGSTEGAQERARLLALVGLEAVGARRVQAMSKGMQQRLGIAQALVGAPRVLFLDEPTSALDPAGRRVVRDLLTHLRQRGTSVLLNSHLLSEIELVCDRVLIMSHGKAVAEGTPSDLLVPGGVVITTDAGERRWPGAVRDDVPRLVADLVSQGRSVYEVRLERSTLEDFYLQAVDGEIS